MITSWAVSPEAWNAARTAWSSAEMSRGKAIGPSVRLSARAILDMMGTSPVGTFFGAAAVGLAFIHESDYDSILMRGMIGGIDTV